MQHPNSTRAPAPTTQQQASHCARTPHAQTTQTHESVLFASLLQIVEDVVSALL
jgi:hypothetical protein